MPKLREAAFWVNAAGAAWVLGGYPASLLLAPRRSWRQGDVEPTVTVVVPTYRERDLLPIKLSTVVALEYPTARLQLIVVSDGNAELADVAREHAPQATVVELAERGGKPRALNAALEHATGEIVVLTDAHSPLEADALRQAVAHFADPSIGAVSGRWSEQGSAYDRYEHALRLLETRSGSTASFFGAFIAVRRELLRPFPPEVVNDDLWVLCEVVRSGHRAIYEPAVRSVEAPLAAADELERRARIGAGRVALLRELPTLPRGFALRLLSHKVGRLALPGFLIGTLAASLSLGWRRPYREVSVVQLALYGAGAGSLGGAPLGMPGRAAAQLLLGNIATARGVWRAVRRRQNVHWESVR